MMYQTVASRTPNWSASDCCVRPRLASARMYRTFFQSRRAIPCSSPRSRLRITNRPFAILSRMFSMADCAERKWVGLQHGGLSHKCITIGGHSPVVRKCARRCALTRRESKNKEPYPPIWVPAVHGQHSAEPRLFTCVQKRRMSDCLNLGGSSRVLAMAVYKPSTGESQVANW